MALAALILAGCGKATTTQGPVLGDGAIASVEVVASGLAAIGEPLDATPDPTGTTIYFSAMGSVPVIHSVPAAGGPVSTITVGAPLERAQGLAMASNGAHAYVADPKANRIFSVAIPGGATPTVVTGTEGWSPQGLEVVNLHGADLLYFTGIDPADRAPGLFTVPAGGGTVAALAKGGAFTAPEGVVVAGSGVAYVTDHASGTTGSVLQVSGSAVTTLMAGIHLGMPAGITLGPDDKKVLVSSMNATSGADQVLFIDLTTGKTGVASRVIGANHDSSGGLHRARDNPASLAWANCRSQVYSIRLRS